MLMSVPTLAAAGIAAVAQPAADLGAWLLARGYVALAMRDSGIGHLYARATIDGREVDVLIDTGASNTVVDATLARTLGLKLKPSPMAGAGVGDSRVAADIVEGADVRVGGVPVGGMVYTMDLTQLGVALRARGVEPPSLILGGDAMRALHAVLVYHENRLYLRRDAAAPPR